MSNKVIVIGAGAAGTMAAGTAAENGADVLLLAPSPEAPSMVKALDIYCKKIAEGVAIGDVELKENLEKEEFIRSQQTKLQKKTRTRTVKKNQ